MRALVMCFAALTLAFAASAQAPVSFKRPDCSAYSASLKPERKCIREVRRSWQEANYAALQKTGLMFVYMARPDPKANPDALKVVENKVEGSFVIRFSVKTDGTVYDVQTVEVTERHPAAGEIVGGNDRSVDVCKDQPGGDRHRVSPHLYVLGRRR